MGKILDKIKEERNVDFSHYRDNILARRVMVRVRMTKRENFEQYLTYLKFHPVEMDYLMDAMTINVTEFFRDPAVFEVIEKKLIPDLFSRKERLGLRSVRVWSCGCASGKEAYSMLMVIVEFLGAKLANYKLSIYGTDIDAKELTAAKEGIYEASQFKNLPSQRELLLDKYFYNIKNERYWIREEWSPYLRFQYHDVIADLPPEHMDIILCRNVFIYFNRGLQEQILERFYNSLNRGGYLILGNVESILSAMRNKFIEYDRKARIYIKK